MHAQDRLPARGRNLGRLSLDDATAESMIEAQARGIGFEHPQMQARVGLSRRQLRDQALQERFTDALTSKAWQHVKIVDEAAPAGVDIVVAAGEGHHRARCVAGHVDQLGWRPLSEPS